MSKPIVLWTNIPSFHIIGPFLKLSESRRIVCVFQNATSSLRADMWRTPNLGDIEIFYLSEQKMLIFSLIIFSKKQRMRFILYQDLGINREQKLFGGLRRSLILNR